jgi:NAD(P)-dependent dehydrogenase (short-subunit alcohol dehydrogenase family)
MLDLENTIPRSKRGERLTGKVAVVTGASRGLGRATAVALAREGASVALVARDQEALQRVAQAIAQNALAVPTDVSDSGQVQNMMRTVLCTFGRVDILVCCAGIVQRASIFDLSEEDWDRTLAVNLKGCFNCVKAVAEPMREQGSGKIVTISSDAGKRGGTVTGPDYSASKGGVLGFMKGIARQLAPYGINVNDVCPSSIRTERWDREYTKEQLEELRLAKPIEKHGTPEDVAAAVLFLVSEDADHIVGCSIDVSGGDLICT